MSRTTLLVAVLLAVYALVSLATSLLVALAASALRARRLSPPAGVWFWLRLSPAITALMVSVGVVLPAFALYEPTHGGEQPGPVLVLLAGLAIAILVTAVVRLGRATWASWHFKRRWLRVPDVKGIEGTDLPVHIIDRAGPLVALVGVLRPRLVVSSDVMAVCSSADLAVINAHETAHLGARDNLKRLLLDVCPDVLRWSRVHDRLARAWSAAAEEAADDDATGPTDERARMALAALLVKLARVTPGRVWDLPLSSPLIQPDDFAERVRRLLEPGVSRRSRARRGLLGAGVAIVAACCILTAPDTLAGGHRAYEYLVQLGR